MNKVNKILFLVAFLAFLASSFSFFFERNDFLGEMIDIKSVKSEIKNDPKFETSKFQTINSNRSKFRRMDLSSFLGDKELKNDLMSFDVVKNKSNLLNKTIDQSEKVLALFSIIAFIFAGIVIITRKVWLTFLLNIILATLLIVYDKMLSSALLGIEIEKKIFEYWGVAQSVQHLLIFGVLFFSIVAVIFNICNIINCKKKKENCEIKKIEKISNNISNIKKSTKLFFNEALKNKFAYYMLIPATIVVILIIIYPFFYNFRISFSNLNLKRFVSFIQGDKLYFTGLGNYAEILFDPTFWTVFLRTIIWTFTNVFFHVVGGVFLAILLNRDMKFKRIYQTIIILPWAVPQFIAVLVWKGMFNSDYGAVNLLLTKTINWIDPAVFASITHSVPFLGTITKLSETGTPMVAIPWLTDPTWAFTGAILTNIWLGIPFMMMIALGGLQSIPETYYEAADIDGASAWQKIWNITIPQLKPVMTPAIIMGVVWTFNNLNVIYLLTTDSLTGKVDILVTYVYKAAFNLYRYGYAAAFSAIIFAILMIFSVVMIKSSKAEEGVK